MAGKKMKDTSDETANKIEPVCLWCAAEGVFMMIGKTNTLPLIRTPPVFKLDTAPRMNEAHIPAHTGLQTRAQAFLNTSNTLSDACKCVPLKETNKRRMLLGGWKWRHRCE